MTCMIIFIVLSLAVGFFGGLLVGRNNRDIADKVSEITDNTIDKIEEKIKDR